MPTTKSKNPYYLRAAAAKVRAAGVTEIYSTDRQRAAAIRTYEELIRLLQFHQPMSSAEILAELYQPRALLQSTLRNLIRTGLLVKVEFEQHTLYVLNGHYNELIKTTLK